MKFNIEFDSSDGSIKIKSGKASEESLIPQPTTTMKSAVDEDQDQNAGAFSGVPPIEKQQPISRSSRVSSSMSSDISSGGSLA
jgi:hypothetical protein